MSKLSIVITDFNGIEQTRKCLLAIKQSTEQPAEIIVVDHGTTEETKQELAEYFPKVVRLQGSSELWWSGATNLGINKAIDNHADYIMLLNNDCYLEENTTAILMQLSLENDGSIIAPIQKDLDSQKITSISPSTCFLLGFPTLPGPREISATDTQRKLIPTNLIIGGRGVIIPVSIFNKVGLFDDGNLPHYGADHDFYLRARKQRVKLYTATKAFVNIDNRRTTSAENFHNLSTKEFFTTLISIRSHRNIKHINQLFIKHYPIKYLHWLGVFLYVGRYTSTYIFKRLCKKKRINKQH